jgi:Photosynthesis system II assembly factor YCF48/Putative zinc-finger
MEQLPKIVQQRLQGAAKPGVHPDPDLLTAFVEKSLNDRERGQVLQHLADCADCRDALSLAMPEIQPALAPGPERPKWLSWPVLRWGALAACVVVVSAAVTLHYEHREPMRSVAEKVPAALADLRLEGADAGQSGQLAANIAVPSPTRSERDLGAAAKLTKQRENGSETSTRSARTEVSEAHGLALDQNKKVQEPSNNRLAAVDAVRSADKPASTTPAAVPEPSSAVQTAGVEGQVQARNGAPDYSARASSETVTVESAATPTREVAAQTAERKAKDESGANESQKQIQAVGGAGRAALGDRKADTFSGVTTPGAATDHAGRLRADNNLPRWTLSPDGALQRSFDSGKTWQTIPVASNVTFRALAANDSDIWVGGAAGALYHSSDAGQHWTRITPVAAGKFLSADIVTVEFSDAQHGKVITANRETWTTSDAGETWQRQ